jgi:anthranilate synthase/aminodeoxychorismate synthase-like glutamine amidotransferase
VTAQPATRNVLLIDNLDSFTFNLVEAFQRLGCALKVLRNGVDAGEALALAREMKALVVLSPGPGGPEGAGCCLPLIAQAMGHVPVLGVCLGHQAIVHQAGGPVERAPVPVHGKSSLLRHDGAGPFASMTEPVRVGRYHSLCTREVPGRFTVHAEIDGMAMAISDRQARQTGLQFHPESILTAHGDRMLVNILDQAEHAA